MKVTYCSFKPQKIYLYTKYNKHYCMYFLILISTNLLPRVDEDEEIIVKAMTDYWVVGKKSDQRELYVILNQKNANLIEVNGMSFSRKYSCVF